MPFLRVMALIVSLIFDLGFTPFFSLSSFPWARVRHSWTNPPMFSSYWLTGPQKDNNQNSSGHSLSTMSNAGHFPNALPSTMPIASSHSSNSLYQQLTTAISSSLPAATAPIHHIPQSLLSKNFCRTNEKNTCNNTHKLHTDHFSWFCLVDLIYRYRSIFIYIISMRSSFIFAFSAWSWLIF